MSVSYGLSLKSTRMTDVINCLDAGSGNAYLQICTANYALVLVTIQLQKPSWTLSTASGNAILYMNGTPLSEEHADNTGQAAAARFLDSDGVPWITNLVVGVGSGDVQLNSLGIVQNQIVTITSATIQHSP